MFGIDKILKIKNQMFSVKKGSLIDYLMRVKAKLKKDSYDNNIVEYLDRVIDVHSGAIRKQKYLNTVKANVALSIGGDNYCYGNFEYFIKNHNILVKNGVNTVLWGCSLNKQSFSQEGIEDLNNFKLITPREQITYDLLIQNKIRAQIVKCADPAFSLDTQFANVPWENKTVIGINCSPMILHCGESKAILQNYIHLINYITKNLGIKVALIPHVNYSFKDSDYRILKELHEMFADDTYLVGTNYNCCELKHIISTCDFFIGARTHSTIAAYSSCVPTLVVGYSTKANGIAMDLFGEEFKDYVVNINDLQNDCILKDKFINLYKQKNTIKKHLEDFIPNYRKTIQLGVDAVKALVV